MTLEKNVSLSTYSTIRLGGTARYLAEVKSEDEIIEAISFAKLNDLPILMIGGGSNSFFRDGLFDGVVLVNKIPGINISLLNQTYILSIGAGEIWDNVVLESVKQNLSGIECLSLIPGTAGGGPVQNIGAYGQEIADTFLYLEAIDKITSKKVRIDKLDLKFGYRDSALKHTPNRYFITKIVLGLKKTNLEPPFYASLDSYLKTNNISDYSPISIRNSVINLRNQKLPNPKDFYNLGSFFKNPIVSEDDLIVLKNRFSDIPNWKLIDGRYKLSAAWLIDKVGFKNFHDPETGMFTWKNQPLVVVNELATSVDDLIKFRDKIILSIEQKFDITLEQEPIILP